ncbi:hypothetical protein ACI8AC_19790 [Geodermatophilus sp. SYSU D00758]
MTHSVDTPFPPPPAAGTGGPGATSPQSQGQSTKDVAKDEARAVGQTAGERGSQVASTAADQAKEVAAETKQQAQALVDQGRSQLRSQAVSQQQKAAQGLTGIAEQLRSMAEGNGAPSGPARDLVTEATDRVEQVARWLQDREPADLLDEVRSFARRKPGTFLLGAALAGVVAGRLTSGVKAAHSDSDSSRGRSAGYRQTNYVEPAPTYSTTPGYGETAGYAETTTPATTAPTAGTTAGTAVPPPPYGTVPPAGTAVPPTTPAGWDDPTRRPGQGV